MSVLMSMANSSIQTNIKEISSPGSTIFATMQRLKISCLKYKIGTQVHDKLHENMLILHALFTKTMKVVEICLNGQYGEMLIHRNDRCCRYNFYLPLCYCK